MDKVYRCLHPIEKRLINLVADSIIKELKEDRMRKLFSYRTVKLCSSALCNGLLGNINDNVASSDITIIDNSFINVVSTIKFNDEFVYKSANYQQRTVMTKQVNSSHKNTLLILGHELKMLRYLGSHENIIKPIGLTESIETISSIFEHVATIDLVEYARMHPTYLFDQVKWIIKNLTSALQFIHSKSIILNNLVEQSILMRPTHGYSVPVIIDFSCACHTVGVTCLTQYFQEKFSKTNHLPNEVLCGNRKPSFSSDIYSFGHLISTFASKMINRSGNSERCTVENIAFELLHSDHENFPDILYNLIS